MNFYFYASYAMMMNNYLIGKVMNFVKLDKIDVTFRIDPNVAVVVVVVND